MQSVMNVGRQVRPCHRAARPWTAMSTLDLTRDKTLQSRAKILPQKFDIIGHKDELSRIATETIPLECIISFSWN